jgi:Zn-dependent peptidase ImmA (M78 family)
MAERAYITPKVLRWARESARMSEELAAARVSVPVSKLIEWEEGLNQPTIRQAQTLAKAYRRPFALLFLPEIPRDFQPLQDYRKKGAKELSTSSVFIIREIQQKQAWISEVYAESKEEKLPFIGRFSIQDDPSVVAANILKTLKIKPPAYQSDQPIKEWIDAAESSGIFVSRTSFIHSRLKLDADEIQGFAIADPYAPFVFVNSDDWNAPQLFTLVHELAHLWIAATGISNEINPEIKNPEQFHPIERFCNQVTANALMPQLIMLNLDQNVFSGSVEVFKTARKFGVSSFAFLIRAFDLGLISLSTYKVLKKEADAEYQEFLKKEAQRKEKMAAREGGPSPYLLRLNKNSRLFTQVVLDAFKGGFVEPNIASFLLNTPVNNFPKLEAQIYK